MPGPLFLKHPFPSLPDPRTARVKHSLGDIVLIAIRAGIANRDLDGRHADFHALRHSCVSFLSANRTSPKVAQVLAGIRTFA